MAASPRQNPLLPRRPREDRPLIAILAAVSFTAALMILLSLSGYRLSQTWETDLNNHLTVQIYPEDGSDTQAVSETATHILTELMPTATVSPLSEAESEALLTPWLGQIELPADVPVPLMISVKTDDKTDVTPQRIKTALADLSIDADVDDHTRWRDDIDRTRRAAGLAIRGVILTALAAALAVTVFAARSVMFGHREIVNVLNHVGAADGYIIRLFSLRFFRLGLYGAMIGAVAAVLFALIIIGFSGAVFPGFSLQPFDHLILLGWVIIAGVLCALTAGLTARSELQRTRYRL